MNKKEKRAARIRISNLLDDECKGCTSEYHLKNHRGNSDCDKQCKVLQELLHLGNLISNVKEEVEEVAKPNYEQAQTYMNLKKQGLKDKEIALKIGITQGNLPTRKVNWSKAFPDFKAFLEGQEPSKIVSKPSEKITHTNIHVSEKKPTEQPKKQPTNKILETIQGLKARLEEKSMILRTTIQQNTDLKEEIEKLRTFKSEFEQKTRDDLNYVCSIESKLERATEENQKLKELLRFYL